MKKFRFRLQKLLDARAAKEEEIKHELAKIITQQNVFRLKQDELRSKVAEQKQKFSGTMKTEVRVDEMMLFHRYWDFAGKAIKDAQIQIDNMEPAVNEVRMRLTEAVKERKTIEKFKEKKLKEWTDSLKKAEEKEYDDINQKLFQRRLFLSEDEIPETEEA